MGPTLIFDKSTLEGLNPDEAMWLDNFFNSNITPLFFVETLADLEKNVRKGRTPEGVVGSLAGKTPDMSSKPNVHHRTLLEAELAQGAAVEMDRGRPIVSQGRAVALAGKTGVVLQRASEEEALARWGEGRFLDVERLYAKAWREALSSIDLENTYRAFQVFFPIGKPKSLADVKSMVDVHLDAINQEHALWFGMSLLGMPSRAQGLVLERWRNAGRPPIKSFAPYARHVMSVDLFFNLAVAADLVGRGRPSHRIDLAYLYYLPFCMVFTSNDKLHAATVPLFLRGDQSFVPGTDLKADLAKLDAHYEKLTPEVKNQGVMSFASRPPLTGDFLVTRLWDEHMSASWREDRPMPAPNSEAGKSLAEEVRRMVTDAVSVPDAGAADGDKAHFLIVERCVRARMGKWQRFPPEARRSPGTPNQPPPAQYQKPDTSSDRSVTSS